MSLFRVIVGFSVLIILFYALLVECFSKDMLFIVFVRVVCEKPNTVSE